LPEELKVPLSEPRCSELAPTPTQRRVTAWLGPVIFSGPAAVHVTVTLVAVIVGVVQSHCNGFSRFCWET
jgi:hypothetical protein